MSDLTRNAKTNIPRNISIAASGTILSQLINISGFALASVFINPTAFGIFGLHIAISAPLAILATARYEASIVHAGTAPKIVNILTLSIFLSVIISIISIINISIIIKFYDQLKYINIYLIFFLILLQSNLNIFTQMNNYRKSYGVIAISRVVGATLAQAILLYLAIVFDAGEYALGFGLASGMLVSICIALYGNRVWLTTNIRFIRWLRIVAAAKRNISYLIFTGPQALFSALQESVAIGLITIFFGQASAGIYVFANRLMRAPISIVAESVGRVLQVQFRDMMAHSLVERRQFLINAIIILSVVASIFGGVSWTLGPTMVEMMFSQEWWAVGEFVRMAAPYYAAYLVGSSLAAIPLATGDHRPLSILAIGGSLLYVGLIAFSGLFGQNFTDAFFVVSVGMFLYFCSFVAAIYYFVIQRRVVP